MPWLGQLGQGRGHARPWRGPERLQGTSHGSRLRFTLSLSPLVIPLLRHVCVLSTRLRPWVLSAKEDGANQIRRSYFVRLFAPVFSFYMAHDFLLIIVVSLLFMSMLRVDHDFDSDSEGGCDCGFVISYCLLLLMTLILLPGYIPSFPDVERMRERERKTRPTGEKFDGS